MCQVGDIIVIMEYKDKGKVLNKHSFIVIDDEEGQIGGIPYDFIGNVMSSFKTEEQKRWKLDRYPANFPIVFDDRVVKNDNGKDGYIKADQLYYFQKDTIKYEVIGSLKAEIVDLLIQFIEESDFELEDIIDNLENVNNLNNTIK